MQSLRSQDESLDAFLVLAILSISARFTPSLIERYGGKQRAVQVLSEKALSLATDRMLNPTIQVVQAFHLLGLTDWTLENGFRSRVSGVTVVEICPRDVQKLMSLCLL